MRPCVSGSMILCVDLVSWLDRAASSGGEGRMYCWYAMLLHRPRIFTVVPVVCLTCWRCGPYSKTVAIEIGIVSASWTLLTNCLLCIGVMFALTHMGPRDPPLFPRKSSKAATGHNPDPVASNTMAVPVEIDLFLKLWCEPQSMEGSYMSTPDHWGTGGLVGWMGHHLESETLRTSESQRISKNTFS